MKKKNQEELKTAAAAEKQQNGNSSKNNSPNDTIRDSLNIDRNDYSFKKSLHGYDVQEVDVYLREQNQNTVSVCRVYDSKIKDLKDELSLCIRERDAIKASLDICREELGELKDSLTEPQETPNEDTAETNEEATEAMRVKYEKSIDDLNEKLAKALLENERLQVYCDKAELLTAEKEALEAENTELNTKIEELRLETAKLPQITAENESLFTENTTLKAERKEIEQNLNDAIITINEKDEKINELSDKYDSLRKEASALEIRYSVLEQQSQKAENEVEKLREVNKKQAYEYAEKINNLENEHADNTLTLQKQLQVHSYHVKQTSVIIEELYKQFSDVKSSLENTGLLK